MKQFAHSAATFIDASKFRPFGVFHNYYIHYSTWLGAVWPWGVITLLVSQAPRATPRRTAPRRTAPCRTAARPIA
jgi:hypothetical protein